MTALALALVLAADLPGVPVPRPSGPAAAAETLRWLQLVADRADHGGWLVIRGTHTGDQAVAAVTLGLLSHAAVLDKERAEVIEALANGVVATPLRRFVAHAHRLVIVRPPGWTPDAGRAAVAQARSRVGRRYDWTGLVGVQEDARFYCTELCIDAYGGRGRGWPLGRIIFPADVPRVGQVVVDTGTRGGKAIAEPRFARRLLDAKGVSYAAEVAPGIYRGGQPDQAGIAWLKSLGIKTIINLRHYHGDTESERAAAAGLGYHRVALESSDAPKRTQVTRFLELVRDPKLRPVYVHCLHGVDRTGTMMAVYRMESEGWSNAEAFAEMEFFKAHKIWHDLRKFVRRYKPGHPP